MLNETAGNCLKRGKTRNYSDGNDIIIMYEHYFIFSRFCYIGIQHSFLTIVRKKQIMDLKTTSDVAENRSSSTVYDVVTSDDDTKLSKACKDVIENKEIMTNVVDYTESNSSKLKEPPAASANVHCLLDDDRDDDNSNVKKALSCMTIHDLNQFLNVYKIIKNPDPDVDKTINNLNKVSMDKLLSGQLLNGEHFDNQYATEAEESVNGEEVKDNNAFNDYTVYDVYDHIEGWKTRMQPMMSQIEDIIGSFKVHLR